MKRTVQMLVLGTVVGATAVSFLLIAIIFNDRVNKRLLMEAQGRLAAILTMMNFEAEHLSDRENLGKFFSNRAYNLTRIGAYELCLIGTDGVLIADSSLTPAQLKEADNHGRRPEVIAAINNGEGQSVRYSASFGGDFIYSARQINFKDGGPPLVLRAGLPFQEVAQAKTDLLKIYGALAALGILFSGIIAWVATRPLGRDICYLTEAAEDLAAGRLDRRLLRQPKNELAILGVALNRLASRFSRELREAQASRDHLLGILKAMDEGVMVTDASGVIINSNPTLEKMFQLDGSPLGMRPGEVVRLSELALGFEKAEGGEEQPPLTLHFPGPPEKFIEARLRSLSGEESPQGVVAVFHDLTKRQRLYQLRRDLVANFSHELRTPLTALMAATETLVAQRPSNAETVRLLKVLERQGRRLTVLADEMSELAKLEAVKPQAMTKNKLQITELFKESTTAAIDATGCEPGRFKIEIEPGAETVEGDREILISALRNLLDNAVKYGFDDTPVELKAGRMKGGDLKLSVVNQGLGVPKEDQDRVFERFYRGEKGRLRHSGGAGLGLAIVKHAAQIHGGRAVLELSSAGKTVFSLILP